MERRCVDESEITAFVVMKEEIPTYAAGFTNTAGCVAAATTQSLLICNCSHRSQPPQPHSIRYLGRYHYR